MFCPKCGTRQDEDSRFCGNCGADLSEYLDIKTGNNSEMTPPQKNTVTGRGNSSLVKICIIVQAIALSGYGLLACVMHQRMAQYDIFSISQVGKPLHMTYMIAVYLGLIVVIYSVVTTMKNKQALKKYTIIVPAITMLVELFNSGANKVYTATSGGTLSGFLGYGMSVGRNGYDIVDNFYYSNTTVVQYAIVAIIGLIMTVVAITRKADKSYR